MGFKKRGIKILAPDAGWLGPRPPDSKSRIPCAHDKRYTGMSKLNNVTWTVGFKCAKCGDMWAQNLDKIQAHEARREFWGPGFSEDVEQYISMVNGWKASVGP